MRPLPLNNIVLSSGRTFDFVDHSGNVIDIRDIAHALAYLCRFTGHSRRFYSVAQHSVMVSRIVPPEDAMAGLLHDAAEAFLGDVSTPLKKLIPDYQAIEFAVEADVFAKLGIDLPLPQSVKQADLIMLATEKRDLLPANIGPWPLLDGIQPLREHINPLQPGDARDVFMARYFELVELQ